jgi:hypothetical protein
MAYAVGYALCKAEHDRLGWPPADERIQYPKAVGQGEITARSLFDIGDATRPDAI